MGELKYAIMRYTPSLVSGESINLAALFYYVDTDYREFYSINNWNRVAAFDDTLNIPMIKDILLDIQDAVGTSLTNPDFDIKRLCARYSNELHFDKAISLSTDEKNLSKQIDEVKRMYFQFELEKGLRPKKDEQKRFLGRILKAKEIEYRRDDHQLGKFNEPIVYDYSFSNYGIKFFNFDLDSIQSQTINKVKAWAWNCANSTDGRKVIIFYNSSDDTRADVSAALSILKESAFMVVSINEGFGNVINVLDKLIS